MYLVRKQEFLQQKQGDAFIFLLLFISFHQHSEQFF